jgi:tungstate transport system permease protein
MYLRTYVGGMNEFAEALGHAGRLLAAFDPGLWEIVFLSLEVSCLAVVLAALCGFPLGAALSLYAFPGRRVVVILANALMGLPPVVVGLTVYLLLSRSGPLGDLGLLFTPVAMVIAQWVLVTPIITALTRQVIEDLWEETKTSCGPWARPAPRPSAPCCGKGVTGS